MNTTPIDQKPPELNDCKSSYLHKTKHDLHGAMHVVTGMSQVLAMSDTLSPAQRKAVSLLKRNADLTMELIDNMFQFLEEGKGSDSGSTIDNEGDNNRQAAVDSVAPLETAGRKPYALLVEDSEPNRLIAGLFLEELGYNYDVAKSGTEALDKFSVRRYDIIIMDVQMPGMDGLEAARQIRAIEKSKDMKPTPILATTGNATDDDRLFCNKAGMDDYLSKPFGLSQLEEKLRKVITGNR